MKQLNESLPEDAPQHSVLQLDPLIAPSLKLYCTEYADQARKLCSYGLTEIELADWFGIDGKTVTRWKSAHAEFRQAVDVVKIKADANVAAALYRRAVGYDAPAVKVSSYKGKITKTHYTVDIPPCVTACMFWLKSRKPNQWGSLSELITLD